MATRSVPLFDKSGEQADRIASPDENPVVTEVKDVVADTKADLTAQHEVTPSEDGANGGAGNEQPTLKKITVPKGAIVEFEEESGKEYTDEQLRQGFTRYDNYTRKMAEVDEQKKTIAEGAKKVEDNLAYLRAIQNDKFGFLYTNLIVQGTPPEKAMKLAMEGAGMTITSSDGKTDSPQFQLPKPPDDLDPNSEEFAQWIIEQTAKLSSKYAEGNLAPQLAEIKNTLEEIRNESKRERERTEEENLQRQKVYAANLDARTSVNEMLESRFGAEFAQWPQEKKDAIYIDLHKTLLADGKNPVDEEFLHKEIITAGDYAKAIVTSFPASYKAGQPAFTAKAPVRMDMDNKEKPLQAGPQGRVSLPLYGGDSKREKSSRDLLQESEARMNKAAKPLA